MTIQNQLKNLAHRDQIGDFLNSLGLTGKGVEVGTLYGAYASAILSKWNGNLNCIDPWINQSEKVYFDQANELDMDQVFDQCSDGVGRHPRCTLHRTMSLNGVGKFDDYELDFVYLDGNHSVEAIREDISAWWPKVKIGGIFSGHDFFTRYDSTGNCDALTAVMELSEAIGIRPHVTWCSSWWFIKTEEADLSFQGACVEDRLSRPVYTTNPDELVVVIPVAKFDWNLAVKMLTWWSNMLNGKPNYYPTIALCSTELTAEQRDAIGDSRLPNLSIVVANDVKELGYFGSPNQMIRLALEYCEVNFCDRAMLWVEADTVPMRPSWVSDIAVEYYNFGRPFMGALQREGPVPHLSGNAVYHPQWRTLAPSLAKLGQEACGWDSLCAHDIVPRCHVAKTIQQIWRPQLPITEQFLESSIRPETALFHQCKDGSLIDVLCRRDGLQDIPLGKALCESTYETDKIKIINEPGHKVFKPKPRYQPVIKTTSISVEILIVTHAKDIPFLRFCLASIHKNTAGFTGTTLVVPSSEREQFKNIPKWVKIVYFDQIEGKGVMHHVLMKCRADELCPNADAILHVDADCMFWTPTTPVHYAPGAKPIILREKFSKIGSRNTTRMLWQKNVERALGFLPEYETMVAHPNIYLRSLYPKMRSIVQDIHGIPFDQFALSGRNEFPQSFQEFTTLGATAIKYFNEYYNFVDYDHDRDGQECGVVGSDYQYIYRRDRDHLVEAWSHGGIDRYKSDWTAFLDGKVPAYYLK